MQPKLTKKDLDVPQVYPSMEGDYHGCLRLWRYVLHQLNMDAESEDVTPTCVMRKAQAIAWLTSNSVDCKLVCEYADLPHQAVRAYFVKKFAAALEDANLRYAVLQHRLMLGDEALLQKSFALWLDQSFSRKNLEIQPCISKRKAQRRCARAQHSIQLELLEA